MLISANLSETELKVNQHTVAQPEHGLLYVNVNGLTKTIRSR